MTVGRLATATGIPVRTLQRRLDNPDDFRAAELAVIATELGVDLELLTAPYVAAADAGVAS